MARKLVRLPDHGRVAGVCAGIAAYLNTDLTLVRLTWVLLSIFPGALIGGVLAYAGAWLLMPASTAATPPAALLHRSSGDRRIGGVCGGLAKYFGLDATVVRVAWLVLSIYPGAIVCGLIAYAIAWFVIPPEPYARSADQPIAV